MKFGTKLKLKKNWEYGILTFEKGEILQVALYRHKHGLFLYHPQVGEMIDFVFGWNDREKRLEEWFEVLEDKCTWKINHADEAYIGETWDTSCKHVFQFMDGDIEENNFKYCPYCAKNIQEYRDKTSNCCNAPLIKNTDLCSDCKEHTEFQNIGENKDEQ